MTEFLLEQFSTWLCVMEPKSIVLKFEGVCNLSRYLACNYINNVTLPPPKLPVQPGKPHPHPLHMPRFWLGPWVPLKGQSFTDIFRDQDPCSREWKMCKLDPSFLPSFWNCCKIRSSNQESTSKSLQSIWIGIIQFANWNSQISTSQNREEDVKQ